MDKCSAMVEGQTYNLVTNVFLNSIVSVMWPYYTTLHDSNSVASFILKNFIT